MVSRWEALSHFYKQAFFIYEYLYFQPWPQGRGWHKKIDNSNRIPETQPSFMNIESEIIFKQIKQILALKNMCTQDAERPTSTILTAS